MPAACNPIEAALRLLFEIASNWKAMRVSGQPSRETFEPHRNATFRIRHDSFDMVEVTLTSVDRLGSRTVNGTPVESFSLVFRGPAGVPLPQMMYTFEHDEIGTFALFIVPIGPDDGGLLYEAVFN